MSSVNVPNFGELLSPYISKVPEQVVPNFLALLERGAARRYRDWAEQLPEYREGLLACSASEDKIADIVEAIFPTDGSFDESLQAPLPGATETYYNVFNGLSLAEQLEIQADAELQGAEAWRKMLSDANPTAMQEGLMECMKLEKQSSDFLYSIIGKIKKAS